VVRRTAGVTASFIKELLRRAALGATVSGRGAVTDDDVRAALDELLSETSALTRVLLGGERPAAGAAPDPHGWMTIHAAEGQLGLE
jgi:hypothetical protein